MEFRSFFLRPASPAPSPALPPQSRDEVTLGTGRFAVVGDLQRTSRVEVWRESNREERERILAEIVVERPDFLAMLGDLVFCGSSRSEWAEFDGLCAPLREARVPVLPILGNHEYWVSRRPALENFFSRFPHLEGRHWYSIRYGPLGLILLDSNMRRLAATRWREQVAWYGMELHRFENDPQIRGVLVLVHHPPYTNSTLTPDERHVQQFFVPGFSGARKTLAMLSGHVHSYERFERAGKVFLVAGGGGGPRVKLATGRRRRHADDLFDGPPRRFFHFLILTVTSAGLEVETKGLEKGGRALATMDRFRLSWPAGVGGEGA